MRWAKHRAKIVTLVALAGCAADEGPTVGGDDASDVPARIDFGVVPGGAWASRAVGLPGATLVDPDGAFEVSPGGVRFRPRHVGAHRATLEAASGTIELVGEGCLPRLSVEPVDFGAVRTDCPEGRAFSIVNLALEAVVLDRVVAPGGGFWMSPERLTLLGLGRRELYVTFTPAEPGDASAEIEARLERFEPGVIPLARVGVSRRIPNCGATLADPEGAFAVSSDGVRFRPRHVGAHRATLTSATQTIELVGEGALPRLAVEPLDLGAVRVGCPRSGAMEIANREADAVELAQIVVSGAFASSSGPLVLPAEGRRSAHFTFAPTEPGVATAQVVGALRGFTPSEIPLEVVTGRGIEVDPIVDRWVRPPVPSVDLVYVIHRSAVDGLSAEALRVNMMVMFEAMRARGADARLTLFVSDPERGPIGQAHFEPQDPGAQTDFAAAVEVAMQPRDDPRLFEAVRAHMRRGDLRDVPLRHVLVSDRDDASPFTVDAFEVSAVVEHAERVQRAVVGGEVELTRTEQLLGGGSQDAPQWVAESRVELPGSPT